LCYTPKTGIELEKALEISNESYPNSGHLKVDKVIELPSLQTSMMFLPAIAEWELIPIEWELREWRTR